MADFDEIANTIVERVAGMAERLGDGAEAARRAGARVAGGHAQWIVMPAAGAALYAAAKNAPASGRSIRHVYERASDGPDFDLVSLVKDLTGVEEGERKERPQGPSGGFSPHVGRAPLNDVTRV
jgi:hypothetical protein